MSEIQSVCKCGRQPPQFTPEGVQRTLLLPPKARICQILSNPSTIDHQPHYERIYAMEIAENGAKLRYLYNPDKPL